MLSSIHPLGERGRHNRWWLTVGAFTLGAVASGAGLGALLGLAGRTVLASVPPSDLLVATAAIAGVAGALDIIGASPIGPRRQVNETWIGAFRGWIYGGGFGLQLGLGLMTYVVTWGVYAMFLAEVLAASPTAGAIVGAVFGLGRSATLVVAFYVDRPSRLTTFNRKLASAGPLIRRATALGLLVLGTGIVATVIL